jgi:hypothetical protein
VRTGKEKESDRIRIPAHRNGAYRSSMINFQRLQIKRASHAGPITVAIVTAYMSIPHVPPVG